MADAPRLQPGDTVYARDYNALVDGVKRASNVVGRGVKASNTPSGLSITSTKDIRGFSEPAIIAQAYNASGAALKMFQPVTISGLTGDSNQSRRILKVTTPASGDEGRWAICAAPIPQDYVGRVYIGGMCLAMLSNPDTLAKCEISDGLAYLIGDENGSAQIFWEDTGDPHLALIRFPFGGNGGTSDFQVADLASTANISSLSGSSGSVDGVTKAGKIILLKNQTTASQNGRYQIPASGTGAWTKLDQPKVVEVLNGTISGRTRWLLTAANTYNGGLDFFA